MDIDPSQSMGELIQFIRCHAHGTVRVAGSRIDDIISFQ